MGLPARQRRALEGIEDKLRSSDPKLAAMFLIFGRLTRDEDMPRFEELRHRAAMLALRIRLFLRAARVRLARGERRAAAGTAATVRRRRRRTVSAPRLGRARGWRPMAMFFPIALVLMSASIFIAARFGGTARCPAPIAVATAKLNPRSKPPAKPLAKAGRKCRATPTVLIGR